MAGVTAADVRAALDLPDRAPGPSNSTPQTELVLPKERKRKPEGIPRELYALIGDSAPSLQAQLAKPRLKPKPNFGSERSAKWEWRPFKNQARGDSLELGHWVKAAEDPSVDYPFAKYDVKPSVYDYSLDEYTRFLEDPEWTKEETDYLFDLMREYDTRFYVVYDRYDFREGPPRTLEDLKDRYCSVCRKLLRNRPWPGDEAAKANLMKSFEFDKDIEVMRKKWVASLESRTSEQIAEEEALFIEIKRLEQQERRFRKDRDELLRTLLGVESGLADLPFEDDSPFTSTPSLSIDTKSKKRRPELDSPISAGPSTISLGQPITRKRSAKDFAHDALHCIQRTDVPGTTVTSKSHRAAHLRSATIPNPKPASNMPKIIECLQELGINHLRLVMPTRENVVALESVFDAANSLVETKKVADRLEQEIRTMKIRLGEEPADEPEGSRVGTPMEVDADAEGEEVREGRAQSVMSSVSRTGRVRKKAGRSMSISSVDTSATASTRTTTTKRQRKR